MSSFPSYLTKESEERLLRALEQVTGQEGEPNALLSKVATEVKLPPGHIPLLVNAYNTGRAIAQRTANDGVWDKAADFPLASTETVVELMYPDKQADSPLSVSSDYSLPPRIWLEKDAETKRKKELEQYYLKPEKELSPPRPREETILRQKQGAFQRKEREMDTSRARAAAAADVAAECADQVLDYFRSPQSDPYPHVRKNAEFLFGQEQTAPFFDFLEQANPSLVKQAQRGVVSPARGRVYELVETALLAREAYEALREDYFQKQSEAEELEKDWLGITEPPDSPGDLLTPGWLGREKSAGTGTLTGGMGLGMLGMGQVNRLLAPAWSGQTALADARAKYTAEKMYKEPRPDPRFEAEVSAIKRESMLHDLLANDDVIEAHEPEKVLTAYKELANLAPRASLQPGLMRDFLRRRLEGGPHSYFDLEGLTRIEKNLAQLESGKVQDSDR